MENVTQVSVSTFKTTDIGGGDAYSFDTQKIHMKSHSFKRQKNASQMADDEGSENN